MSNIYEVNFDGLVGPTHNYSGLSYGNIASTNHRLDVSNPKEAALQGLHKMYALFKMGVKQAVLPPQERPSIQTLQRLGFSGKDHEILEQAHRYAPDLFLACYSASAMWAANAATVAPSADTEDKRVHFTPANLCSKFHRSIEAETTSLILRKFFSDPQFFCHHPPLPTSEMVSDEGAANHTRFCSNFGELGVHLFVYGRVGKSSVGTTRRYRARQTLEASEAVSRLHRLNPALCIFARQNPIAVDAGTFHNDVVSVGNQNLFLFHEQSFVDTPKVISLIKHKMEKLGHKELFFFSVSQDQVSLKDAIETYLFNSQIVTLPNGKMSLIAPSECAENAFTRAYLDRLIGSSYNPITQVVYMNLRESMQNGGGPACLRLRVVLTEKEMAAVHPHVFMNDLLYEKLVAWVKQHYRDRLEPKDMADPTLLEESRIALDELTQILNLGSIYPFQTD